MTTQKKELDEAITEIKRAHAFIVFIGKWNDYYFHWRELTKDVDVSDLLITLLVREADKLEDNPEDENGRKTRLEPV
jgi:hypothetical protein